MRKKPAQQRSQQLVETLLEAAGQVIAERGLAATNTRLIAERAGISVGSLYQYFEDKDAVVAALMLRLTEDLNRMIEEELPKLLDTDVRATTRTLLEAALLFFESRNGLYLEMIRNWHRLDIESPLRSFEQHMQEVFRLYAMRNYRKLRIEHLPARAFVLTNSTVFTFLRYLSLPRPPFPREKLLDELCDMIVGFSTPKKRRVRRRQAASR